MSADVANLIDRDHAAVALGAYTDRLCTVLRRAPDPGTPAIGIWTVGDVANHVASGIENYALWLQDRDAPDVDAIANMPRWNVDTVREMPAADLPLLAGRIEAATNEFIRAATAIGSATDVRWYAGNRMPVAVAVCMRLIEAAVHGRDIAYASKHDWEIGRDDARTMAYGLGYIAPHFVDKQKLDFEGTLRMHIRGGADLWYVIEDRRLRVGISGARAGWHLSADPVAWLLVSTQRWNQWVAGLRGKIVGWGTQPALPFRLRAASFQG